MKLNAIHKDSNWHVFCNEMDMHYAKIYLKFFEPETLYILLNIK